MRLEMAAFLSVRFNFKVQIALDQYETEKLDKLTAIFSIMIKLENKLGLKDELKKAVQLFKSKLDDFDWWILMVFYFLCRPLFPTFREEFKPHLNLSRFSCLFKIRSRDN